MFNKLNNELLYKDQQYSFLKQQYTILEDTLSLTKHSLVEAGNVIEELKKGIVYEEVEISFVSEDEISSDAGENFNNNNN
jgi:hypothetical protein